MFSAIITFIRFRPRFTDLIVILLRRGYHFLVVYVLSTPHQGGRTWFYNSPHLHGYQVVISRGLKCGLNPIRGYSTEAWNPPKYLVSPERIALAGIPAVPLSRR
ncbi:MULTISPECIES: hypothetical protein [Nostoc]|uniref:Uncharacterized protein n=1 Tax=Nostoc paludosum FACHB-159 TaxID=2692908 RepID=A0ABR8KG17_9NOSO|nr:MULTISPECIES: hypothetical protein [Nostoc]MBD2737995.1 hypothetical protein [Nostoc paludosum FACHB-159]